MSSFEMTPVGHVECLDLLNREDHYNKKPGETFKAKAVINKELTDTLDEIDTFDHIWLIFVFDRNVGEGFKTKVFPRPDPSHERGLFTTRSPHRPNPIGLACVRVLGRENNIIHFENSDILDGTPILDIKPYIPKSDSRPDSKAGWLDKIK